MQGRFGSSSTLAHNIPTVHRNLQNRGETGGVVGHVMLSRYTFTSLGEDQGPTLRAVAKIRDLLGMVSSLVRLESALHD